MRAENSNQMQLGGLELASFRCQLKKKTVEVAVNRIWIDSSKDLPAGSQVWELSEVHGFAAFCVFLSWVRSLHRKHFISGRQTEWQADSVETYWSSCTCISVQRLIFFHPSREALPVVSYPSVSSSRCFRSPDESDLVVLALACFQCRLITLNACPTPNPAGSVSAACHQKSPWNTLHC